MCDETHTLCLPSRHSQAFDAGRSVGVSKLSTAGAGSGGKVVGPVGSRRGRVIRPHHYVSEMP